MAKSTCLAQSSCLLHSTAVAEAVPKKILELMKVDGLTRENVASHLQKYRLYLKRVQTGQATHAADCTAVPGAVVVYCLTCTWGSGGVLLDLYLGKWRCTA
jgi:hypothetical protein